MNVNSFGWHSGDLKTRKAETSAQMSTTRSTGYFGTGWYFLMGEEPLRYDDERELWKINLKPYNLLQGTIELHDSLKKLTRYVYCYENVDLIDDYRTVAYFLSNEYGRRSMWDIDSDDYGYDKFKQSAIKIGFEPRLFELIENPNHPEPTEKQLREYHIAKEKFDKETENLSFEEKLEKIMYGDNPTYPSASNEWSEEMKGYNKKYDKDWEGIYRDLKTTLSDHTIRMASYDLHVNWEKLKSILIHIASVYENETDSIPTLIMKALGYEGIYPAPECNNGTYGGVIYDLKEGTYEKVADPIKNAYALSESEILKTIIYKYD